MMKFRNKLSGRKIFLVILSLFLLLNLGACAQKEKKEKSPDQVLEETVSTSLRSPDEACSIRIQGKDLMEGKEAEQTLEIAKGKKATLRIYRNKMNPFANMVVYRDDEGIDLVTYLSQGILDEYCIAKEDFEYYMQCYDVNADGVKEIVIAAKRQDSFLVDVLSLDWEQKIIDLTPKKVKSFQIPIKS